MCRAFIDCWKRQAIEQLKDVDNANETQKIQEPQPSDRTKKCLFSTTMEMKTATVNEKASPKVQRLTRDD